MTDSGRTKDFRYIYSNGQKISFSGNEVILVFGIKEDPSTADDNILEEVGVAMTLATAKLLAVTLTRTVEHFESTNKTVILVDQTRIENLEKILRAAEDRLKASPTA
jgi:hypothetical protein